MFSIGTIGYHSALTQLKYLCVIMYALFNDRQ